MPFARRRFSRSPVRARVRRWQWIRSSRNSVAAIPEPSFQTIDLLDNFRTLVGIDLNFPEFTIWRIRLKVSVRITPVLTAGSVDSNASVTLAIFCDDMAATYTNPVVSKYNEKFLLWDDMYVYKTLAAAGGGTTVPASTDVPMYAEYDLKGHRKLANIGDTLLFQIAPTGASVVNYSLNYNVLALMGH